MIHYVMSICICAGVCILGNPQKCIDDFQNQKFRSAHLAHVDITIRIHTMDQFFRHKSKYRTPFLYGFHEDRINI